MMGNIETHDLASDSRIHIGPFVVETKMLRHYVPNLGLRVCAGDAGNQGQTTRTILYDHENGTGLDEDDATFKVDEGGPSRALGLLSQSRAGVE